MLKLLYGTDFHGDVKKYDAILATAKDQKIDLIHLGSDLLPKGSGILEIQKNFVNGYLKKFYQECAQLGIDVLAFFGNDDIYARKKYFRKYADLLDEIPFKKDEYEFQAYGYVQDYPFRLKTACKLDRPGWKCPDPQLGLPMDFTELGLQLNIAANDVDKYFANKGTIEDDLKMIKATNKTIMAIHQPPWALDLDNCNNGRKVGSKAVYDWIEREQPLVCLCGHIHENLTISGVWKAQVGKTLVIQPGQPIDKARFVYIEADEKDLTSELIEI